MRKTNLYIAISAMMLICSQAWADNATFKKLRSAQEVNSWVKNRDAMHQLSAHDNVIAKAIEATSQDVPLEKLDSVYNATDWVSNYAFEYDEQRKVYTKWRIHTDEKSTFYETEFDDKLRLTKLVYHEDNKFKGEITSSRDQTYVYEYDEMDRRVYVEAQLRNVYSIQVLKQRKEYSPEGWITREEFWSYDDKNIEKTHYLYEWEYYEDGLVKSQTYSKKNQMDLVPYKKSETSRDGRTDNYQWDGNDWVLTNRTTMNGQRTQKTYEEFEMVDGELKLVYRSIERRSGMTDFDSSDLVYGEYAHYDLETGEIIDGKKEEHLTYNGESVEDRQYFWEPTSRGWQLESRKVYCEEYENAIRTINEYCPCDLTMKEIQEFHNGEWFTVDRDVYEYLYVPVNEIGLKELGYYRNYVLLHHNISSTDWQTGEYTYYRDNNFTYNERYQRTESRYYSAQTGETDLDIYTYGDEGELRKVEEYKTSKGATQLQRYWVYEYDTEVLISQVLGMKGDILCTDVLEEMPSIYVENTGPFKPLRIVTYNAAGEETGIHREYFYSRLGAVDQPLQMVPDQQDTRFYNLQGQPVDEAIRGQVVVSSKGEKRMER